MLHADKHLGEKYEKVKVKPIFARNVLLPKAIAILATSVNLNNYKQKMEAADKERSNKASSLQNLFAKIQADDGLTITRKVNKEGTLYAKVHEEDIVKEIADKYSIDTETHLFKMKKKITEPGSYIVPFIYKELKAEVRVEVVGEEEAKVKEEKTEEVVAEASEEKPAKKAAKATTKAAPAKAKTTKKAK
ncbi:50S ribosomal protein L9 [Patescibacteria group bacterium]|nr:50S ribosomal protein L9 [Patescibacteria group bacterium]